MKLLFMNRSNKKIFNLLYEEHNVFDSQVNSVYQAKNALINTQFTYYLLKYTILLFILHYRAYSAY